ncbi:MAG: hypothetical protein D9V47_14910 [Clostridia bacterium]|nr:MAG: hypothetical protein D9V47_14910 [Clostridia bacterium]
MKATRTAILDFLESRFDQRPTGMDAALNTIQDLERLKKLRREVFKAGTLQEALEVIGRSTGGAGEH